MADSWIQRTKRRVVRAVTRRWLGTLLVMAVVIWAAGLATYFMPRTYRGTFRLLAQPATMPTLADADVARARDRVWLYLAAQRRVLRGDYVLASALMMLDGRKMPPAGGEDPAKLDQWDRDVQAYISGLSTSPTQPALSGQVAAAHRDYLRKVARRIEVTARSRNDATLAGTLTIQVDWPEEDTDSARAAMAATGWTSRQLAARRAHDMARNLEEAYLARAARIENERDKATWDALARHALDAPRTGLDAADKEFEGFVAAFKGDLSAVIELGAGGAAGAGGHLAAATTRLQGDLDQVDEQIAQARARLKAADTELARKNLSELAVGEALAGCSPSLAAIQARLVSLRLRIDTLQSRSTDPGRELSDARAELAAVEKDLQTELLRQRERVNQDLSVLQARRESLAGALAEQRRRTDELARQADRYRRLREAAASARAVYEAQHKRVVDAFTEEKLAACPVRLSVLDEPTYPDPKDPCRPVAWVNMLWAVVAAVVAALVYALVADSVAPEKKKGTAP